VRGCKQVDAVDFFETFAPIFNCTTVRLMLILSAILGLDTTQLNYKTAFLHAPNDVASNWDSLSKKEKKK